MLPAVVSAALMKPQGHSQPEFSALQIKGQRAVTPARVSSLGSRISALDRNQPPTCNQSLADAHLKMGEPFQYVEHIERPCDIPALEMSYASPFLLMAERHHLDSAKCAVRRMFVFCVVRRSAAKVSSSIACPVALSRLSQDASGWCMSTSFV